MEAEESALPGQVVVLPQVSQSDLASSVYLLPYAVSPNPEPMQIMSAVGSFRDELARDPNFLGKRKMEYEESGGGGGA